MANNYTSVSLEADKPYVSALKAVAAARGITVGLLVREALDAQYAHDLKPHLDFFSAQDGHKYFHSETEKATPPVDDRSSVAHRVQEKPANG